MKKYTATLLFSIAIFLVAGFALADSPQTWTVGNFKYTKTANGVQVTQINEPSQSVEQKKNASCVQQCVQTCHGQITAPAPTPTATPVVTPDSNPFVDQSQQQTLNIISIAPVSDINVAYGTALASVNLPANITATMSDSSTQSIPVTWDAGTPAYDPNTAGTYVFSGTLTLPANTTNANNLNSSANVIVLAQPISSDLLQTTSPSTSGDIIQQTTSALINGVGDFFNFIFFPLKFIMHPFK